MSLDDIVNVQISVDDASVTQAGFGTPMILQAHSYYADLVRSYTSTAGMLSDGFTVNDAAYKAATAVFSQNPKTSRVKIGRLTLGDLWRMELIPTPVANLTVYSGTIVGPTGTLNNFTFTSDGTATLAEIVAGLVASINGTTDAAFYTATDVASTTVRIDADFLSTTRQAIKSLTSNLQVKNATPNTASIQTQLAAITALDSDWYCLISTAKGEAQILALAAAIEAQRKIFVVSSQQTLIKTSSTADIASQLETLNYSRTAIMYHEDEVEYADAAWAGKLLPQDPGSETWMFKTLAGVTVSTAITDTELGFIKAKHANYYILLAGVSITGEGWMPSAEFIDTVRFVDFIHARLQENVFGLLASVKKVPYTDLGVAMIENEIRGVLQLGISQGGFASDPAPTVTVPKVADVPTIDKTNRFLPDVTFTATLAGAIHSTEITGTVSV